MKKLMVGVFAAVAAAVCGAADGTFRVSDGATATDYATLRAAADAVNEIASDKTATLTLTGDATFDAPACFMRSVTITSGEGGPFTLKRTAPEGCIFISTNIFTGAYSEPMASSTKAWTQEGDRTCYDVVLKDIVVDGGAVWRSDDVTDMTNDGVGPGCLFYLYSWMNASFRFACGRLTVGSGATVQNAEAQDFSVAGAPCAVFSLYSASGASKVRVLTGGKVTRCRGASMSAFYVNTKYYPETNWDAKKKTLAVTPAPVHVDGGEISFCSMNDASKTSYGGVVSGVGFSMSAGCVHDNYSASRGGVFNGTQNVHFCLTGGTLCNNKAPYGGVAYHGSGYWKGYYLLGGMVTNNVATVAGGALDCHDTSAPDQLTLRGTPVVAGNYVVKDGEDPVENNIELAAATALGKLRVIGEFPDGAHIGFTAHAAETTKDVPFLSIDSAFTGLADHQLQGIFCDQDASLGAHNNGEGQVVWGDRATASAVTVTAGGESVGYPSLRDGLAAAGAAGVPATVTVNDDITMSADYLVTGDVTLEAAKAVTVSGGYRLVVANGGKLTLAGEGLTLAMNPLVQAGGELDFAAGGAPVIAGSLSIEEDGIVGLAGAPSFEGGIRPAGGGQIKLIGKLETDVTVGYPNSENFYEVQFGAVADEYAATAEDAAHFVFEYAADVTGRLVGKTLKWPPKDSGQEVFRVTAGGASAVYTSLGDAVAAANAVEDWKTPVEIAITKDATFSASAAIMRPLTLTSAEGGPFTLKRTAARACIYIARDLSTGAYLQKSFDVTVKNLVIDGGARWKSEDLASLENSGVGAGGLFYVFAWMNQSFVFFDGGLVLDAGAVVQNVQCADYVDNDTPAGAIYLSTIPSGVAEMRGAGNAHLVIRDGAQLTRCRGAKSGAVYSNARYFPVAATSPGCLDVLGGDISYCSMTDESQGYGHGGVLSGDNTGFRFKGGRIHHNYSANRGGVVSLNSGIIGHFLGGTFDNNVAKYGAIFASGSGIFTGPHLSGGVFTNNHATAHGGAFYFESTSAPDQCTYSGAPYVRDNHEGEGNVPSDLYFDTGADVARHIVDAPFTAGMSMGITATGTAAGKVCVPAEGGEIFKITSKTPVRRRTAKGAFAEGTDLTATPNADGTFLVWGKTPGLLLMVR